MAVFNFFALVSLHFFHLRPILHYNTSTKEEENTILYTISAVTPQMLKKIVLS